MGNAASIGGYGYPSVIEGDAITEGISGNARGHEISKRSPIGPVPPVITYSACKIGASIGIPLGGKIGTKITGGLGAFTLPIVFPTVGAFAKFGLCPLYGLAG